MDTINPREIIAMSIRNGGRANSYNKALYAISDLEANGYQIIHRDENHGPTLERAAHTAETHRHPRGPEQEDMRWQAETSSAAVALRAMEVKHHG